MTWKDGLRPASFRGVAFHTRDRGSESGRAIVTHEYPKRNTPYSEDMGREARKWSVDAYVVGDDYMSRRDALIRACEQPGPAAYTDHWGRSGRVVCDKVAVKETSDEGRMARLTLSFIEAGAAMPVATPATAAGLAGAASALGALSVAGFAAGGLVGQLPAGLGTAMGRFGLPSHLAVAMVQGLASGQASAVSTALSRGLGLTLSQTVPARAAGSVLQSATTRAITRALPR